MSQAYKYKCKTCDTWGVGEAFCSSCGSRMGRKPDRDPPWPSPAPVVKPGSGPSAAALEIATYLGNRKPAQTPLSTSVTTGTVQPAANPGPVTQPPTSTTDQPAPLTPPHLVAQPPTAASGTPSTTTAGPLSSPVVPAPVESTDQRKRLSAKARTERDTKLSDLLQDLGHFPQTNIAAPVLTPAPPFQILTHAPPRPAPPAQPESDARNAFLALMSRLDTLMPEINNLAPGSFDQYAAKRLEIFNRTGSYNDKLRDLQALYDDIDSVTNANEAAKTEFQALYRKTDASLERLKDLNSKKYNALRNAAVDISNLNDASFVEKLRQMKTSAAYVEKILKQEQDAAAARPALSDQAATAVMNLQSDQIKNLSTEDLVDYMAKLTCHRVKTVDKKGEEKLRPPPKSMQALVKLYGSMQMDPDFLDADKKKRDEVLKNLTGKGAAGQRDYLADRAAWDNTGINQRLAVLTDFQSMQCKTLNFTAPPLQLSNQLDDAGHCSGTQVQVSTKPEHALSFDEMIDTVDHETTHAYQNDMTDKLENGDPAAVKPGDPEYAQVLLFLLNNKAYASPPDKIGDPPQKPKDRFGHRQYEAALLRYDAAKKQYDEERAAYENEPVEAHAWKAGREAAQALNTEAANLKQAAQALSTETQIQPASTPVPNSVQPNSVQPEPPRKQAPPQPSDLPASITPTAGSDQPQAPQQPPQTTAELGRTTSTTAGSGQPQAPQQPAPEKSEPEAFALAKAEVDRLLDDVAAYDRGLYATDLKFFNEINAKNFSNRLQLMEEMRDGLQQALADGIADKAAFLEIRDEVKRLIETRAGGFTAETYKRAEKTYLDIVNRALNGGITYGWKLRSMRTLRTTWT